MSLYLDLMKRSLMNITYQAHDINVVHNPPVESPISENDRLTGRCWPKMAHTMIGEKRLDNIAYCIERVLTTNIAGDFVECGVWRGGASIYAAAVLKDIELDDCVWVCDSFQGLPVPNPDEYPSDANVNLYQYKQLAVSLDEVKQNFTNYGLLSENVRFLKGWFKDTLPNAPIKSIAVLRLDGDLYESTIQALESLYKKVNLGGYIIVDDYFCLDPTRWAVDDFRKHHGITDEMIKVDWSCAYWKKSVSWLNSATMPKVDHQIPAV